MNNCTMAILSHHVASWEWLLKTIWTIYWRLKRVGPRDDVTLTLQREILALRGSHSSSSCPGDLKLYKLIIYSIRYFVRVIYLFYVLFVRVAFILSNKYYQHYLCRVNSLCVEPSDWIVSIDWKANRRISIYLA